MLSVLIPIDSVGTDFKSLPITTVSQIVYQILIVSGTTETKSHRPFIRTLPICLGVLHPELR